MKDYIKILIAVTILSFASFLVVNIILGDSYSLFNIAIASVANGIVLGFVIKKI